MQEKLKGLVELQVVDMEMVALKKSSEAFPKQMVELERELQAAKSLVEAERGKLADLERQKKSLDQTLSEEKDKVKKWEARLAEQRSTREYSALAREIDIAKKAQMTMSEQIVELGKSAAAAREAVKAKEQEFAARQDGLVTRMTDLRAKIDDATAQAKTLDEKRAAVAARADKTLLSRYDNVRKKKNPALVPVIGGTCQGCNMNVPPQLYNTLVSTMGLDLCPSCHRLICAEKAFPQPVA